LICHNGDWRVIVVFSSSRFRFVEGKKVVQAVNLEVAIIHPKLFRCSDA